MLTRPQPKFYGACMTKGGQRLVEVRRTAKPLDRVDTHVVFIHGLSGHFELTWQSGSVRPEFWPDWLEADIPEVAVWSLGYPAVATRWKQGAAMALPDRAANLLPLLVSDPALARGNIVLVGHSLGGLVIKELLRRADSEAPHKANVASFLRRVRKVVFVATPHLGSDQGSLAILLRIILRPREALQGLSRNDPHLASLNAWFRNYAVEHKIDCLVLQEKRALGILGHIVKPDSSDPGLYPSTSVIPVDQDHVSIVKPIDRSADVYIHIRNFVSQPYSGAHADTVILDQIKELDEKIVESDDRQSSLLRSIDRRIADAAPASGSNTLLDTIAAERLLTLRQGRHFGEFDAVGEARRLSRDVLEGELRQASPHMRMSALAWCARLLSQPAPPEEARELVRQAALLGTGPEVTIACAFVTARTDKASALAMLSSLKSPAGRTASFLIATMGLQAPSAIEWLTTARISPGMLDPDGKLITVNRYLDDCRWDGALEIAVALQDDDYEQSPALLRCAAAAHLAQAVPEDLRPYTLFAPPFSDGRVSPRF